jgi:hypothetical protein
LSDVIVETKSRLCNIPVNVSAQFIHCKTGLVDLSDNESKLSNVTFGLINLKSNIKPECNKSFGVNRKFRTNTELLGVN